MNLMQCHTQMFQCGMRDTRVIGDNKCSLEICEFGGDFKQMKNPSEKFCNLSMKVRI